MSTEQPATQPAKPSTAREIVNLTKYPIHFDRFVGKVDGKAPPEPITLDAANPANPADGRLVVDGAELEWMKKSKQVAELIKLGHIKIEKPGTATFE